MIHKTLPNKKELKKNAIPIYKIFFYYHVVVFFLKIRYYYAFINKQMQNNTLFEYNFIQKL